LNGTQSPRTDEPRAAGNAGAVETVIPHVEEERMNTMRTQTHAVVGALAVTAVIFAAACGGGSDSTETSSASPAATMAMDDHSSFDFGRPGDTSAASRTIEVEASDTLKFDPAAVSVQDGETVTFRVHNGGAIRHEFVLGTEADQMTHEQEMTSGMMMADEPNALVIEPGETKEITWTFEDAGAVLFGCHEPGHYAAGMKGEVTVS
jgi:uncharacterized cupredoxin-like copper-binding protein